MVAFDEVQVDRSDVKDPIRRRETPLHRRLRPLECIIPPHMLDVRRETSAPPDAFRGAAPAAAAAALAPDRSVHDAGGRPTLPGKQVRSEGDDPTGDAEVDAAYDGAGHTYQLSRTSTTVTRSTARG
jgi:hypothetical protein